MSTVCRPRALAHTRPGVEYARGAFLACRLLRRCLPVCRALLPLRGRGGAEANRAAVLLDTQRGSASPAARCASLPAARRASQVLVRAGGARSRRARQPRPRWRTRLMTPRVHREAGQRHRHMRATSSATAARPRVRCAPQQCVTRAPCPLDDADCLRRACGAQLLRYAAARRSQVARRRAGGGAVCHQLRGRL